ncbi:MAG: ComEC family competence protein [Clostridia bacterium]|nr:ComEC family competence protein [Clostridia bacterium]
MKPWLTRLPLTKLIFFFKERPLLALTVAYALGIILASFYLPSLELIGLALILVFLVMVFLALFSKVKGAVLYLLFFLLLGVFLAGLHLKQPQEIYRPYYNHYVTIEGFIVQEPEIRTENTRYYLQIEQLILANQISSWKGRIILLTEPDQKILAYGQKVRVRGFLTFPQQAGNPGEFDYAQYLEWQGLGGIIYHPEIKLLKDKQGHFWLKGALTCKARLVEVIDQTLPADLAILFKSMALGMDGELDPEWREVFSQVGVCHLLCVSGLHVGFILLLAMALAISPRVPATMVLL